MKTIEILLVAALWLFGAGCVPPNRLAVEAQDFSAARARRATQACAVFPRAALIKPRETTALPPLAQSLAPLLVVEARDGAAPQWPNVVEFATDVALIEGKQRVQVTYAWHTPTPTGVRITLDARGLPRLWEALEAGATRVFFASRQLEESAQTEFGGTLPGREFALEPTTKAGSDVMVVRLLDDGPVAMGPIIQLTSEGIVSTVLCRCMPLQAGHLVTTEYYSLEPHSTDSPQDNVVMNDNHLGVVLRLPSSF